MGKAIVIANQKGGVGKTTTAVNLAASLSKAGKKTLVIDMDPQGNATSGLGIDRNHLTQTVYELLTNDETEVEKCIVPTDYQNLYLMPSSIDLAACEMELSQVNQKEYILREEIYSIQNQYDYILIDCPPSLNILTINSMCAANSVLIPVQTEYYALEGLTQLLHTIALVSERLHSPLKIEGIVFTMYDSRTNLSQQVSENVSENLGTRVRIFKTVIPRNVRLAEAPSYGMPVVEYDPRSAGAEAYRKLAEELIEAEEDQKNVD